MTLTPGTHERLVERMAEAVRRTRRARVAAGSSRECAAADAAYARAALAVVLDDPDVTVIEGATVERSVNRFGLPHTGGTQRVVGPWVAIANEET